jgi:phosphatidylethanolamine/phosphatidyl-N-methylethanolamine N-methyltransferase
MTNAMNTDADDIATLDGRVRRGVANPAMFFRRWLANPLQMGSMIPSSAALCQRIVKHTRRAADEAVLELGAGTGVVSRALLAGGVPPERLIVVEIVPEMADHLRGVLPGVHVLEGDARDLPALLPHRWHGRIGSVVCGIPLLLLPLGEQRRFIAAIEAVAPGRGFLQYSYCVTSPLPWRKHALTARREAWTPLNFPPASVWRYAPGS